MEMISTTDVQQISEEGMFQYVIPLEEGVLLARKDHKAEARAANKLRRQAGVATRFSPFDNSMSISYQEIQIIHGIINYLDSKSTLSLGFPSYQKHLKEEGQKIDHVHPLCFIWAIVSHPEMLQKLRGFKDNSAFALKWDGFLGYSMFHDKGFGRNMEKYYNHRDFQDYAGEFEAFYRALSLRPDIMNAHASSKQWASFAAALLEERSYY